MRQSYLSKVIFTVLLSFIAINSCDRAFPPENQLNKLRILAIRANPPWLYEGESAVIDALVYSGNQEVTYSWSWCPLRGGLDNGYQCSVTPEQFKANLEKVGSANGVDDYSLGSAETVTFNYISDASTLYSLCFPIKDLLAGNLADFIKSLSCNAWGFPISNELTVTAGGKSVTAHKDVTLLLFQQQNLNHNPSLDNLRIGPPGSPEAEAKEVPAGPSTMTLNYLQSYEMFAEMPANVTEVIYTQAPSNITATVNVGYNTPSGITAPVINQYETLRLSWFVEAGYTEDITTSYNPLSDQNLTQHNLWNLPSPSKSSPDEANIYIVIRDNRGGVDWLRRSVFLQNP